MKNLIALTFFLTGLTALGQTSINLPFNPDSDGNGFISVSDILNVLSTYDTMFSVEEALVDGVELSTFIAETDSTINSLQMEASVCVELQHLEAFEDYLENSTSCYDTYDGTSSCCAINIPNFCRHVTLFMWNSSSSTQTQIPLRLPVEGEFPGQIMEIRITEVYNIIGEIEIQAFQNSEWVQVGELQDNPAQEPGGTSRQYLWDDRQNERFVWDGEQWLNVPFSIHELGWTSID